MINKPNLKQEIYQGANATDLRVVLAWSGETTDR
jgi:hypothetical protein